MIEKKTSDAFPYGLTFVCFILIILMPFILALGEEVIFKTHFVESYFKTIGLHSKLKQIYRPLFEVIKTILDSIGFKF